VHASVCEPPWSLSLMESSSLQSVFFGTFLLAPDILRATPTRRPKRTRILSAFCPFESAVGAASALVRVLLARASIWPIYWVRPAGSKPNLQKKLFHTYKSNYKEILHNQINHTFFTSQ
jgi:hypothetical protein